MASLVGLEEVIGPLVHRYGQMPSMFLGLEVIEVWASIGPGSLCKLGGELERKRESPERCLPTPAGDGLT